MSVGTKAVLPLRWSQRRGRRGVLCANTRAPKGRENFAQRTPRRPRPSSPSNASDAVSHQFDKSQNSLDLLELCRPSSSPNANGAS